MCNKSRTGKRPHYRWNEIQPRHFQALAQSLPDPDLWSAMLAMARSVPQIITSVEKRLPADLKEPVWASITQGFANKAKEFLREAEKLPE